MYEPEFISTDGTDVEWATEQEKREHEQREFSSSVGRVGITNRRRGRTGLMEVKRTELTDELAEKISDRMRQQSFNCVPQDVKDVYEGKGIESTISDEHDDALTDAIEIELYELGIKSVA